MPGCKRDGYYTTVNPNGTYISDIATDMADVILSTAAELVPCSKRLRGAYGRCAGPGVKAEINTAWQENIN